MNLNDEAKLFKLQQEIRALLARKFYGKVTIEILAGKINRMIKEESIKFEEVKDG